MPMPRPSFRFRTVLSAGLLALAFLTGCSRVPPEEAVSRGQQALLDGDYELAIDLGYPKEKVESLVRIGDPVSFRVPFTRLMNNRISFKTFDDRACVACMLVAMPPRTAPPSRNRTANPICWPDSPPAKWATA